MKPHLRQQWCLGEINAEFVAHLEDVLHLYSQPHDECYPLVCMDERPCQLLADVLMPLPMKPGQSLRQDYEYKRNGTACLLVAVAPALGLRFVWTRQQRTAIDYALFMHFVQSQFPKAIQIRLVQDNLNTHRPASFYKAFEAQEAFALTQKFEWHYTPKKASWLNMCELELAVIAKQCLDRRIGDLDTLDNQVQQLVKERNEKQAKIKWQFTQTKAREKFGRFYKLINSKN